MKRNDSDKNIIYDDAMPINAVGKLLGDKKNNNRGGFVKGFDTEEEPIQDPANAVAKGRVREVVHRDRVENREIDRAAEGTTEGPRRYSRENLENTRPPRANNRSANLQSKEVSTKPTQLYNPTTNEDEQRLQRKISANPEEREQRKRRLMGMDLDAPKNISIDKMPEPKPHPRQSQTYQANRPKPPQQQNNRPAADPFSRKREARYAILRVAAIGIFVINIVVLAFLVWNINSLQNELNEAREFQAEMYDLETMQDIISQQDQALAVARAEIDRLEGLLSPGVLELVSPPPGEGDDPADPETPPTQAGQVVHIVQSGESLSLIAQNLMGSSSPENVQAIMQANGLTGPNIGVGQELIIPAAQ